MGVLLENIPNNTEAALELGNGWRLEEFWGACRHTDTEGSYDEVPVRTEESRWENFHLLREYLNNRVEDVGRNTHGKGHSDELSEGNEELSSDNVEDVIVVIK